MHPRAGNFGVASPEPTPPKETQKEACQHEKEAGDSQGDGHIQECSARVEKTHPLTPKPS